jgi:hypothetical protein
MAFGSIYTRDASGWVKGQLYVKDATGWKQVVHLYEKTNTTTWTERFNADLVPPAAPTLSGGAQNSTAGTFSMAIKLPADVDVTGGCVKMSTVAYPTNPGVLDANCFTNIQSDGQPYWSWTGAPGSTTTRVTPKLLAGKKYYGTAWARDASGNWSAPAQTTFTAVLPPAPTKTLTTKTAYVLCTDSASYRSSYGWRTDNNYVYQGAPDNFQGFWFYGTAIATLLKNAYDVTKAELYVQRSSSSHGIAGDGNIMIGHHDLTSQPSGSPGTNRVVGETNIVDLGRGEGKWCTLQSAWLNNWKNGDYRGVGMMYGETSTTSSYYNICYGKGTSSGKLKFTWREYV